MPSHIEKIEKQMQIFTHNEQIAIITHQIDRTEKIKKRAASIDGVNKKFTAQSTKDDEK